ncbi:2551_t:CDS:2 [Funneliformis geosporum]|uniref:7434_t:CDS:1 n=1 Tax=Funneliformis geosporum TaxID=1117311 RepID=A0A9W4WUX8_9GLOM|nr:2551_t:CDS:2 [Funneliformis geosporum]CAI2173993.1 7434_t:CDS:2 [Funneliformis geosporum]
MSKFKYQINIPNSLEINENFFSPVFSTRDNMFWQLAFLPEDFSFFLSPVIGPDEIVWGERSKLEFTLYVNEIKENELKEAYSETFTVPPDAHIQDGFGISNLDRTKFLNGELEIGVIFNDFEGNNKRKVHKYTTPPDLIEAWKDQLSDYQSADVEFNVRGAKFYVCSSILSKRSEYFAKIFSGKWSETEIANKIEYVNEIHLEDSPEHKVKYRIQFSEDPDIFSIIMEYLYTNEVKWVNQDNDSITIKLFRLADKYLLLDLRDRAKFRIYDELEISNVSEILFGLVPIYEDLKGPVLKFMARHFKEVRKNF